MHYTTYIKETLYRFCDIQTLVYISDILYVSVCYYSLFITQLDRLTDEIALRHAYLGFED